jgi:hypothetical protein
MLIMDYLHEIELYRISVNTEFNYIEYTRNEPILGPRKNPYTILKSIFSKSSAALYISFIILPLGEGDN